MGAFLKASSSIDFGVGDVWDEKDSNPKPFFPAVQPHIRTGYSDNGLTGYYSSLFCGGQFPEHFANIENECQKQFPSLTGSDLPCLNGKGEIVFPISNKDMMGDAKSSGALLCEQQLRFLSLAQYIYSIYGHLYYRRLTEERDLRLTEFGTPPFDLATEDWCELIMEDGATAEGENDQDIRITEDVAAGPFATTLVVNDTDRYSLGMPDANSWIYRIDNRYACAMMYQCRPIESICRMVFLRHETGGWKDAVALGVDIAINFLEWYNATWEDRTQDIPTDLPDPEIAEPYSRYKDAHIAALMIRAGIHLKNAGYLSVEDSFFVDLFNFMDKIFQQNIGTRMEGTWATRYPDSQVYYFSYWHGEILQTISALADVGYFGIDQNLCRSRLSSSRKWLEKYGVFSNSETEMDGYDYYNGFIVLSFHVDESLDMSSAFNRNADILDNKIVPPVSVDTANKTFKRQTLGYSLLSKKDILWMKKFFYSRKGMLNPFLLPSFTNDYILQGDLHAHDTSIKIKSGSRRELGDIAIKLSNGYFLYNTIKSIIHFGEFDVAYLESPVGKDVRMDLVDYISAMEISRLSQDRLDLSYISNSTAKTTLNVITDLNIRREENVYI